MLNEKLKYYRNIKGGAKDANDAKGAKGANDAKGAKGANDAKGAKGANDAKGANGNGGNKANGNSGTNAEVEAIIAANNNNTEKSNSKKYGLLDDLLNFPGFKKLMVVFSEPCLVLPSEVRDNYREDTHVVMKGVQTFAKLETMSVIIGKTSALSEPGVTLIFKTVIGEFLSFFLFNPFLYWTNSKDKSKWGNRIEGMFIVRNALSKFLYCFLKIFGSPMILLFFAIGLFFYFLKALNIIELGKTIGQIIIIALTPILLWVEPGRNLISFAWNMPNTEHYNIDPITKEIIKIHNTRYMPFGGAIIRLIGLIVPLQLIHPVIGKNYGYGGIGILILIFTIISGLIIFLGGINILFIGGIFTAYIAKVISGLSSTQQK